MAKEVLVKRIEHDLLEGPVYLADSFMARFKGLMLKQKIADQEGLFFTNVSQVHSSFMKFSIDVVHFDKDLMVVGIETLKPWRIGKKIRNTRYVLEVNEGVGSKFIVGEKVRLIVK